MPYEQGQVRAHWNDHRSLQVVSSDTWGACLIRPTEQGGPWHCVPSDAPGAVRTETVTLRQQGGYMVVQGNRNNRMWWFVRIPLRAWSELMLEQPAPPPPPPPSLVEDWNMPAPAPAVETVPGTLEVQPAPVSVSVLEGSIDDLRDALASGDFDPHLDTLLRAEKRGKDRKGAKAAIGARIAFVERPAAEE